MPIKPDHSACLCDAVTGTTEEAATPLHCALLSSSITEENTVEKTRLKCFMTADVHTPVNVSLAVKSLIKILTVRKRSYTLNNPVAVSAH